MINNELFQIIVALVTMLVGWYLKTMDARLAEARALATDLIKKLSAIEVLVVGEYVRKSDFDKRLDAMFLKLDRIEELLHNKADK